MRKTQKKSTARIEGIEQMQSGKAAVLLYAAASLLMQNIAYAIEHIDPKRSARLGELQEAYDSLEDVVFHLRIVVGLCCAVLPDTPEECAIFTKAMTDDNLVLGKALVSKD